MPNILVVDDDVAFCNMLKGFLERQNFSVLHSFGLEDALQKLENTPFTVLLTDLRLPNGSGIDLLEIVKSKQPNCHVVVMTGYAEVGSAVDAMKKGAADYIAKPFAPDALLNIINKLIANNHTATNKQKSVVPKIKIENAKSTTRVVGISEAAEKLNEHINLVAPTNMSVFINGASGTGKEVTARAIHENSRRCNGNFIAVDCGAIPKELAASEFFGHVKGSFTGAVEDKIGCFEASSGGTLFLDEVGNLSYENQIQLLRALQERKIKKVGSTKEISVDIRLVTATNEDLQQAVAQGKFREDLYHRLNEFTINVPALKERRADLPLFLDYFLNKANAELDKNIIGFSADALQKLTQYAWPGNLRELQNLVKRMVLLCQENEITVNLLPPYIKEAVLKETQTSGAIDESLILNKEELEKKRILKALEQTKYNKTKAAKLLQVTRKTLYNKIAQYKLEV
ncbi:sigma-54-dependent transcriptional regulator [Croceivirga sp. JEA036]|uniref:sigma-54-dependent transcriptional regulator n=1 Tax=Croceivirga sp. JEA036 TaxID=2721162 RepID=UPI00143B34F6|nr:sigma-54 dependent transcriptional regulator [Croceivirga sp. JEA036]NJB36816.1 sigma-54-dependent Fis family transcriptional regulator [Croceivirga sp. JEA036]